MPLPFFRPLVARSKCIYEAFVQIESRYEFVNFYKAIVL